MKYEWRGEGKNKKRGKLEFNERGCGLGGGGGAMGNSSCKKKKDVPKNTASFCSLGVEKCIKAKGFKEIKVLNISKSEKDILNGTRKFPEGG